jgi:hypothetical protein
MTSAVSVVTTCPWQSDFSGHLAGGSMWSSPDQKAIPKLQGFHQILHCKSHANKGWRSRWLKCWLMWQETLGAFSFSSFLFLPFLITSCPLIVMMLETRLEAATFLQHLVNTLPKKKMPCHARYLEVLHKFTWLSFRKMSMCF